MGMAESLIFMGISTLGFIIPLVGVILLAIWLINKRRRDELVITLLSEIRQRLDEIRDHLEKSR